MLKNFERNIEFKKFFLKHLDHECCFSDSDCDIESCKCEKNNLLNFNEIQTLLEKEKKSEIPEFLINLEKINELLDRKKKLEKPEIQKNNIFINLEDLKKLIEKEKKFENPKILKKKYFVFKKKSKSFKKEISKNN